MSLSSLPPQHPRGGHVVALAIIVIFLGACRGENTTDTSADPPSDTSAVDTMTVDRVLRTDDRFSTLTIENARGLENDIETANGFIHVIDAVLRPPAPEEQ